MKRIGLFLAGMALLAGLAAGCGGAKQAPAAEPAKPAPAAEPAKPAATKVVIDVIPTQKSDKFQDQIKKLGELLSKESGLTIEMRIATDYATVVEEMRFSKIDVAFFGPFTYVVANAQSGAQAFITQNIKGKPYYYSYGIVLKDSPIKDLDDKSFATLKDKTIALGDPASTSSSQIPQLALKNAGILEALTKEKKLNFTGAHDAVLKTVAAKKADIGFVDSAIFEGSLSQKFPQDFEKVRVAWKSTELYQYPWAARKDLDPAVVAKLKEAFLKITDKDALEPFGADAFVPADDAKYNAVRDAARALNIELKEYKLAK